MMYKKLYYGLFNDISDAIYSIENKNPRKALEILKNAQIKSEKVFIEQEDNLIISIETSKNSNYIK